MVGLCFIISVAGHIFTLKIENVNNERPKNL